MFIKILNISLLIIICTFNCEAKGPKDELSQNSAQNNEKPKITPIGFTNNLFTFRLMRQMPKDNENVLYSPFSISMALMMLYHGSKDKTASEIRQMLAYDRVYLEGYEMAEDMQKYLRIIASHDQNGYKLDVANRIAVQKNYKILDEYSNDLKTYFNSTIDSVDFTNGGDDAIRNINEWVRKTTHNKIPKLLEKPIDPLTKLILLNAIYFKGTWKYQFDKKLTRNGKFNGYDSNIYNAQMMNINEKFRCSYSEKLKSQLLEMPYEGNNMSMYILLPTENDGLKDAKIYRRDLNKAIENMTEQKIVVSIPKFKFTSSYVLNDLLKSLGMKLAFSSDADLSGINGKRDLYVSKVVHKALIEVNEEGSEAAGVTGVVVATRIGGIRTPTFIADHPFMFFIRDNINEVILFAGHVKSF